MGRWRPPQPKSAPYITPAGFAALQKEQDALWVRRRDVVAALSAAAAEGDRSENAEYIYRKKELAGIDRRIRYLQKRVPELQVVDAAPRTDRIFFGACVALLRDGTEELSVQIVGADEIDGRLGRISVDSPLARSLLGKGVAAEVTLTVEGEPHQYSVLDISCPD
ncbi:MAG: GreA/GreB family elongation factor [Pseudomonadota bacterium]